MVIGTITITTTTPASSINELLVLAQTSAPLDPLIQVVEELLSQARGFTEAEADQRYPKKAELVGGLGDFSPDGALIIACGDSTTEQFNQNGGGSQMVQTLRLPGEVWQNLSGFINFGGSGYTLKGFVDDPVGSVPTIPATGVGAVSTWDTYGHKPTGAISLATALAWRAGKADRVLWRICYGINDMILYGSVGNLPQFDLTAYLEGYLRLAINRIRASFPQDSVLLECPNPMTARPFVAPGPGFPSITAYPTFGADLPTDAALVEKWNQSARAAYLSVRNEFPKTIFNDSWAEVFGPSRPTLNAVTELPFLVNLVHPTGVADQARIRSISRITNPKPVCSEGRRAAADLEAVARNMQPWEIYPAYFRENPRYRLSANTTFVGAGSNYLDLGIPYSQFLQQVSGPLYVAVGGDRVAQVFSAYTAVASGSSTRLIGVAPSAAMQAAVIRQTAQLYLDNTLQLVAGDLFVNAEAVTAKEYFAVSGLNGGIGYIDFSIPRITGRVSSKFAAGLKGGRLITGGTVNTALDLSTATVSRAGTTAQRAIRLSIAGDYSSYAGQPAAIVFADDKASPKSWERVITPTAVVPLTAGAKGFLYTDVPLIDGVTFSATLLGAAVAVVLTVDIYTLSFGARTLLGTISIPSNSAGGTLSTGNPTTVAAGAVYEAVYSGASTSAVNALRITATPL